jgi:hypothetical protein
MVTFGILVDIESKMKCSFSHGVVALFESMIGGMTRNPARLFECGSDRAPARSTRDPMNSNHITFFNSDRHGLPPESPGRRQP